MVCARETLLNGSAPQLRTFHSSVHATPTRFTAPTPPVTFSLRLSSAWCTLVIPLFSTLVLPPCSFFSLRLSPPRAASSMQMRICRGERRQGRSLKKSNQLYSAATQTQSNARPPIPWPLSFQRTGAAYGQVSCAPPFLSSTCRPVAAHRAGISPSLRCVQSSSNRTTASSLAAPLSLACVHSLLPCTLISLRAPSRLHFAADRR